MLPVESSVTPGISLLPRTRGPMPERKRRLPTRFAWGNAPTGSGARELSKDWLMIRGRKTEIGGRTLQVSRALLTSDYIEGRKSQMTRNASRIERELSALRLRGRAEEYSSATNLAARERCASRHRRHG